MVIIRVRACIQCKEYVIIKPNESKNLVQVKAFDKDHFGHALVTLDMTEVKDRYSHVPMTI